MATAVVEREMTFNNGRIRVDFAARALTVGTAPAKLGSRAFDLLEALIDRRGRLVPKQELMDVVWPGLVVEENNLQVQVMTLRKLLGADAIVTASGRGYRFALLPDGQSSVGGAGGQVASTAPSRPASSPARLFGRDALTASICDLVRRRDVRLVTLTGAGGSGKTRVALHVTAELAHDFADGSYIVMLAPVRDPAFVASAIAAVLQVQEAGSRSSEELLIGHLVSRHVLLTLDNFEHLAKAASLISRLLDSCPRLKVLLTSRSVLRLTAEHDVVVPPLVLPEDDASGSRALDSPAVQLFVERAKAAGCSVGSSKDDVRAIAQICRRLDGLPLALELAAPRLHVLSPQTLRDRLDRRLQLLKAGPGDLPERQKTLRGAIGWSYDLLGPSQRALFRRLSVFVGGWSLEASEQLVDLEEDSLAVVDDLGALVDQSLIQRIEDVNGQPRFVMLETVREYAHEQLEHSGEAVATRRRHAKYFVELAERTEPRLTHAERKPWLDQVQAELNNFRAALTHLIEHRSQPDWGLRLAAALPWMWYFGGLYSEGRRWLDIALSLPASDEMASFRAKALSGAARLAIYGGDPASGARMAEKSIELWRQTGDKRGLAFALFHLGIAVLLSRGSSEAHAPLQESLVKFEEVGDRWGVALATTYYGITFAYAPGSEAEAKALLLKGRALFAALNDDWGLTTSSHYLGTIALRQGDYAAARELTEEMMRTAVELADNYRVARNLHQLSEIAVAEKKYPEAIEHLKASLSVNREQGRLGDGAQQLRLLARLELLEGRSDHTVRLLAAASRLGSQDRTLPPDDPAISEKALADARQLLGEQRYQHEWSMGQAMTWDQIVSWALAA